MRGDTLICNTTCIYGYGYNIGVQEVHTAVFDKKNGEMKDGEWKNPSPGTGTGSFKIIKKAD
ncbi:hypothetical protein A8C56_00290 [Niabella ginsenosidivorans]|uniref:Uncharacterized protein n=2 Tax=Niabella ginsenosidivorans TaxID=1176587 RepID=A0A1A9HW37_9BACT|nr:hypothetical protein A8C56_00290 [Niabella ginsenosidivorans]